LKNNTKGFSLIELLIVIALMGILMAIAYPSVSQWQKNAQFKTAARHLAGVMMEARSRAISSNLEHEISFDLGANKYMLRRGNRASNTELYSTTPADWQEIYSNQTFAVAIEIKAKEDCSENTDDNYRFQFLPNGTFKVNGVTPPSDSVSVTDSVSYICIVDKETDVSKFKIGVPFPTTGRVELKK
jgi:prepilin-type N-terminal cleavage/methylation domain-containing protein